MWVMFLRENGRWSIFHRVKTIEHGLVKTICGWEYPETMKKKQQEQEPSLLMRCHLCSDDIVPSQDIIRFTHPAT